MPKSKLDIGQLIQECTNTLFLDIDQLLQECTNTLVQWDGESIAEKAQEILGHPVKYLGDSMFQINEDKEI